MLLFLSFILGTLIGSFLNVLILRLPKNENISFPASHCPKCQTPLRPWHNIPLFSWLFLRGKCAFCNTKISWQYPVIESLSGLIFLMSYLEFGYTLNTLVYALVFDLLLVLSIIDWRYKAVPDSINLLAFTLALTVNALYFDNLVNALLLAGGLTMLRFFLSYYLFKKLHYLEERSIPVVWRKFYNPVSKHIEAMGEADIIVAGTMGALLGIELALFALFLSAILTLPVALIRKKVDVQTPFVPFLALATLLTFLFYPEIYTFLGSLHA